MKGMPDPLFPNEEQVRKHLRMGELTPPMEKALMDLAAGKLIQPVLIMRLGCGNARVADRGR